MQHPVVTHFSEPSIFFKLKDLTTNVAGYDLEEGTEVFSGRLHEGKPLYHKIEKINNSHLSKGDFRQYEVPVIINCVLSSAYFK